MSAEASHYVVTAHPPGSVLLTATCNFLSSNSANVIVAKSRRLEVRQASPDPSSPFPLVLTLPINGRITSMVPLKLPRTPTDYLFITTDRYRYAVISYSPENTPYPCQTHASGSLKGMGREAAVGPLVAVDPHGRCLCLHLYDGLITVIPIHVDYVPGTKQKQPYPGYHLLGEPYQLRLEERAILDLAFLHTSLEKQPHVCLLHQDAHSAQHVITYTMDIKKKQLVVAWKKGRVDGGSSMLLVVPSVTAATASSSSSSPQNNNNNAGVVVVGQRQITFLNTGISKVVPLPFCLVVSAAYLAHGRFLLGDEFGNLHILTIQSNGMDMETLGSCVISSSLAHVQDGLVYVASQLGDSQLVQIHQEPLQLQTDNKLEHAHAHAFTSFLEIVEEYTNLGPIVDFDLVPTHAQQQSQVVTCSGSSTSGSLRLIRNGIGMNECASVEMEGIQNLWSIRNDWSNVEDAYLVQSFVGETRVLGVSSSSSSSSCANNAMEQQDDNDDTEGGTLEEVILEGLDSTASSLHVGNVQVGNSILQITESEIRLMSASSTTTQVLTATWSPEGADQSITVASANEAGQIVISLRGGVLLYLRVMDASTIELVTKTTLEREVSCVDLHPFVVAKNGSDMMVDMAPFSNLVAVGLWDDFTVRLLSLDSDLNEVLNVNLGMEDEEEPDYTDGVARRTRANMMARSLCLISLDSANTTSSSSSGNSVDMLFVGLGDGTLISFAVLERDGRIGVHARKEVSLGTQRINLVPLQTEQGGRCVLATGDRPTVIYLAGGGAGGATAVNFSNPKLCYSNVNLSASDTGEDDDVNRPPAQQIIAVNAATPFVSPQLFDTTSVGSKHFCLCVSDDSNLRLGIIDDIQKLHVTTCRLGMAPRRVVHCSQDRMFAVGCIESGLKQGGSARDDVNMGNCIRFLDDTTFDDIERIDLEPFEMILSMVYANLGPTESASDEDALSAMGGDHESKPYLLIGTGYALPDEDEPTRGRIIVMSCSSVGSEGNTRKVRHVTELQVRGGVYALCQFYNQKVLATVNSKTHVCELSDDGTGVVRLSFLGIGHHGHILSLFVKSKATRASASKSKALKEDETMMDDTPTKKKAKSDEENMEQLAIVGDLMRSISLVQYYPEHKALEEIARDFNANWTTAIEMLTDDIYLGAENWNHLYVLRRNTKANSEEVRCRLDTIGEFHLGEMCNKFMCGSLIMPHSTASSAGRRKVALRMTLPSNTKGSGRDKMISAASTRAFRPTVTIGTQTLFATVDGTLGSILGLDARTTAFFKTLERAMAKTITPVGDLSHDEFRAFNCERRVHPSHGFVDGDLVESFLDLDRPFMEAVVKELNRDGGWDIDNFVVRNQLADDNGADEVMENELELAVEDVLAMVEEMTMFH